MTSSGAPSTGRELLYWGEPRLVNRGDEPITLRSARPLKAEGMRVRRVMVAGPDRSFPDFGIFEERYLNGRFHRERWRALAGYRVPPRSSLRGVHKDVEVVFVLEPVRRGTTGRIDGVRIEYDGGAVETEDHLRVCAPRRCPLPPDPLSG